MRYNPRWLQLPANRARTHSLADVLHKNQASDAHLMSVFQERRREAGRLCETRLSTLVAMALARKGDEGK